MFRQILKRRLKENRGTQAPNVIVDMPEDGEVDSREDNEDNNAGIRLTQVSAYIRLSLVEKGMKILELYRVNNKL